MDLIAAIKSRRSVRKFLQQPVKKDDLVQLVDLARLSASPANIQPLRYCIVHSPKEVAKLHPLTRWAAYLPEYTISDEERPGAYILVLGDKSVTSNFAYDAGAATTTIMLAALSFGLSSCCLGALDRKKIAELYKIDTDRYEICYALALGVPAQENKSYDDAETVKYSVDENGCFLVPKIPTEKLITDIF